MDCPRMPSRHSPKMALQTPQLPSLFPFASQTIPLLLRLRCSLKSSSKCFVHSDSQFRTPRRRRRPVAYPPHGFLDQQADEDDRARLHGAGDDPEGDPVNEEEEELQEFEGEDGEEVGEWDPPVSPFSGLREESHHQEEDDDGAACELFDPSFFLSSLEGASDANTIATAAKEEILAFARSQEEAAEGSEFAEFLSGYTRCGFLSERACVELMGMMGEEGLAMGCVHLFRWMREQGPQPAPGSSEAWLVAIVALGRCRMADEILEIVASLPPEKRFREAILYKAAMSGVAYCGRYDCARTIFELMEKNNVQPDHETSSIMLNVMKNTNTSARVAWEFFQRMDRKGVNWSLDVAAALINIFCCEGLKKEALIIQSEMERRGIATNTSIYNTLMREFCKSNQIEEAEGLFVELKEKGDMG